MNAHLPPSPFPVLRFFRAASLALALLASPFTAHSQNYTASSDNSTSPITISSGNHTISVGSSGALTRSNAITLSGGTLQGGIMDNVATVSGLSGAGNSTTNVDANGVTIILRGNGTSATTANLTLASGISVTGANQLLVGGGGGGGGSISGNVPKGGGGGGGYVVLTTGNLSGTLALTAGGGGAAGLGSGGAGGAGGTTSIGATEALGGGLGVGGGSGKGTGGNSSKTINEVTSNFTGGAGVSTTAGGGGAGSSTNGSIGSSQTGGRGGNGTTITTGVVGLSTYLGSDTFGGGGGGGAGTTGGAAGTGGGGAGSGSSNGAAGTDGLGGGGGGGGGGQTKVGGAGGAGSVAIQYAYDSNVAAGNLTLSGGITLSSTSTLDAVRSGGLIDITTTAISGSGDLNIASSASSGGVVRFSVANTYSGTTTINSGATLELANVNALQNTTLDTGTSGSQVVSFTMAGANTYNIGAIQGGDSLDFGANTVSVGANNATTSFTGILAGSGGSLTKAGTGTLTISGPNTYTGTTTINAGTLALGANQNLGAIAGAGALSLSSFTLTTNSSTSTTFSGSISGTGGLTKAGSSTLTLSGSNTYDGATTINAGTLQLGGGGTTGSLSTSSAISIGTGAVFSINRTNTVTQGTDFSGSAITGTGGFLQNGSGTTVLNATNTYTGTTALNAGTLQIDGNIANSALVINTGGIISPGTSAAADSFGTSSITINGGGYNWTLSSANGSAGTGYDQITSTGALTSSGLLTVNIYGNATGWDNAANYSWDIFSANSVTGFSTGNFAYDLTNFGISAGNRTGDWAFTNSGGVIQLTYTAASGPVWAGGAGNWTTGFTTAPTDGANIAFTGVGGTATNNISNGTLTTVGDIEFRSGAGAYTLAADAGAAGASGGTALTVNGSITNSSTATQTINTNLAFAATRTIAATTGNITIGGAISGAGGLTKNGTKQLTLSGNNTYSGATTINEGALRAAHSNALGSTAAGTTVASGAALELSGGISIGGEALSLSGAGISSGGALRNISGDNSYAGTITLAAASRINSDSGLLTLSGAIGGTFDLTVGGAGNTTISNAIGTSTGTLTKDGAGTLTLSGANTYTGATTVSAGTLTLSGGSAIVDNGAVSISSGAVLNLGASETVGTIAGAGNVTLGSFTLTTNASSDTTLSGVLSGSGALTKSGAGTLTLSGNSTYSGTTTISAGTLEIGGAGKLGGGSYAGAISIVSTFTYNSSANQTLSGNISGAGMLVKDNTSKLSFSGTNSLTGNITINAGTLELLAGDVLSDSVRVTVNANGALLVNAVQSEQFGSLAGAGSVILDNAITVGVNNASTEVSGVISGTGSLTKAGTGTLTLSGNSTYSGATTITAGTLEIGAGGRLGGGSYAGAITNNANFIYSGTNNQTLTGVISGTGALTQNAASTLTLSNAATAYSGPTTISAGTLSLNFASITAAFASSTTVNAGATLRYAPTANSRITGTAATVDLQGALVYNPSGNFYHVMNSTVTANAPSTIELSAGGITSAGLFLDGGLKGSSNVTVTSNTNGVGLVLRTANSTYSGTLTVNGNASTTSGTGSGLMIGNYGSAPALSNANLTINGTLELGNALTGMGWSGGSVSGTTVSINALNGTGAVVGNMQTAASTRTLSVGNNNGSGDFSGVIANGVNNTLGFIKNGSGTQTLSGANTYTGTTTINAGTVVIGAGGTTGSLSTSSSITVNGTLAFNRSDNITQATHFSTAAIGGTGSIVQNGGGTLTLNAANTYSGGTTLNTGTLVIGNTAAAGSGTITQTDGTSLLKFDTTGTITNAMSVYNVLATQSATLSGAITVNNATWEVDSGDTLTVSGNLSGTGGTTKNGTGTLVLSGNNSNTGATTVNAGTLNAASANALGSTSSVVVSNGGSLLVTAGDSVNDSADFTLAGGTLAVNGTFNETVGLLTLSANSIIDLDGFTGTLRFGGVGSWASNTTLAIWNWNGINQYTTPVGSGADNRHVVFTSNLGLGDYLDRISFYSDNGSSFAGTAFEQGFSGGGTEIIAVPEPETWATGILLVLSSGIWLWRKRTQTA